ncbi:hypothetical protein ACFXK0_27075 [Nocardia sp. NPDC059177]|uniref:hypothetical protein n=1 Tax=Nocardia sp. NPDC059177 TaxID=3346759 RepID=UPI0036C750A1
MATVHRIPIPTQLLERFGVVPGGDDAVEFGYDHYDVSFTADGQHMITLSRVYAGPKPWRGAESTILNCFLITKCGSDGEATAAAIGACSDDDGRPSQFSGPWLGSHVCALPSGSVAVSTMGDCTYLIEEDLAAVQAAFTQPHQSPPERKNRADNPFVSAMRRTPGGRLLCLVEECDVYYGNSVRNLVGVADDPLTPTSRPPVHVFATRDDRAERQTRHHQRPYLLFDGAPVLGGHRPQPTLATLVPRGEETVWINPHRPPTLRTPEPLSDDLFVVPLFSQTLRGGSKGLPFVFALLDDTGKLHGRLEGMDAYRHSPYAGSHERVSTDPDRGLVYHLNKSGLFVWAGDGTLLSWLDTAVKEFKPLAAFELRGCAPDGDIVLIHPKQHLLLRIPVPDPKDPGPAVADALRDYRRLRTTLKKAHTPASWGWTWVPDQLHYL